MRQLYLTSLVMLAAISANAGQIPQIKNPEVKISATENGEKIAKTTDGITDVDGIIVSPDGEKQLYLKNGDNYSMYGNLFPMKGVVENAVSEFIYGADNVVYIKNIISAFPTNSYVRGTLANNTITVELPQLIYMERTEGEKLGYYVERMVQYDVNDKGEVGFKPDDKRTMTFKVAEDGSITMENSYGGRIILAIANKEGSWLGFGEYDCTYTKFNEDDLVTVPENLEIQDFLFCADGQSKFVNLGFDKNDVYVQGIFKEFPQSWVKGTITEDNKLIFKSGQYLGYNENGAVKPEYFVGATIGKTPNGQRVKYDIIEGAEFNFDPATKTMSSKHALLASSSVTKVLYSEYFREPVLRINAEDYDKTPLNPYYVAYSPWNEVDSWCGIQFRLPNVTKEMNYLDMDHIYWRMFIDGEVYLFDYDLYPQFGAPTEWVSYNNDGMEINNYGTALHTVILFNPDIKTIGVQSRYMIDDSVSRYSDIVQYEKETGNVTVIDNPLGIESIASTDTSVVNVVYFSINGVKVSTPTKGIYVKQITFSDGSTHVSKVVVK